VPIYNVLMKIHHLGIRDKCYKFIEKLYLFSMACVRVDGQLSESFSIKKGVRKGCPLSSILFNLFINDIFNNYDKYGISIGDKRCCGGFFANGIVLCVPTRSQLKKLLNLPVSGLLFRKYMRKLTSSVNAENAVKQASMANASEGEDHNFFQIINSNHNP